MDTILYKLELNLKTKSGAILSSSLFFFGLESACAQWLFHWWLLHPLKVPIPITNLREDMKISERNLTLSQMPNLPCLWCADDQLCVWTFCMRGGALWQETNPQLNLLQPTVGSPQWAEPTCPPAFSPLSPGGALFAQSGPHPSTPGEIENFKGAQREVGYYCHHINYSVCRS